MNLEQLDRRAFMRGMMFTSAGLLVPKPVQVAVPAAPELLWPWPVLLVGLDIATGEWIAVDPSQKPAALLDVHYESPADVATLLRLRGKP